MPDLKPELWEKVLGGKKKKKKKKDTSEKARIEAADEFGRTKHKATAKTGADREKESRSRRIKKSRKLRDRKLFLKSEYHKTRERILGKDWIDKPASNQKYKSGTVGGRGGSEASRFDSPEWKKWLSWLRTRAQRWSATGWE